MIVVSPCHPAIPVPQTVRRCRRTVTKDRLVITVNSLSAVVVSAPPRHPWRGSTSPRLRLAQAIECRRVAWMPGDGCRVAHLASGQIIPVFGNSGPQAVGVGLQHPTRSIRRPVKYDGIAGSVNSENHWGKGRCIGRVGHDQDAAWIICGSTVPMGENPTVVWFGCDYICATNDERSSTSDEAPVCRAGLDRDGSF